jgi:exodeoxyribonuclease V gamma subunit
MATFELTFANRFELLLDRLLCRLDDLPADPFEPVQVIVPGSAVRRRIELAIAERHGVCANVEFAFLASWLWRVIGQLVPVAEQSPFDAVRLQWRLFDELDDPTLVAAHPRLAVYLREADPSMRLALAQRVAALFEQLIIYRPGWLAAWLDGRRAVPASPGDAVSMADEAWQAELWRRVSRATGASRRHPSAAFFEALAAGAEVALPARLSVFALPALPPLYLDMLRGLARFTDIGYFALNPCREYWFEIVAPRRLGYLRREGRDALHEVGHPLLAAWGRQTQSHIDTLLNDEDVIVEAGSRFEPAGGGALLARLQDAILDLHDPPDGSITPEAADRSIELHVCHSLMRELQVLHDQLLAMFDELPGLQPAEVAVLLPELAEAAPLIDAVFGSVPAARRIPFAVTGLPRRQANEALRALDSLMRLLPGRLPASAVFELMEQAPVARRFGWSAEELERLREWFDEAGIRWGLTDQQRAELGLPAGGRASFDEGLRRLYIAYACGETREFGGWLGAANPQGQQALLLGRLTEFVAVLRRLREVWCTPADADGWRARLLQACEALFAVDAAHADGLRELRAGIGRWHQTTRDAQLRTPLDAAIVHQTLVALLDEPAAGAVPGGAVTFAAIGGLRGLPYRVICVLGLNDRAFPHPQAPLEFDLIGRFAQRGDRQRRDDERTLFLDLLLSARDRLYLSYTGRHARDNSAMPPSVLVSELFDHLRRVCTGGTVERLIVHHPLAAFSVDAFIDDPAPAADRRRRSFNESFCRALVARQQARAAAAAGPVAAESAASAASAASVPSDAPVSQAAAALLDLDLDSIDGLDDETTRLACDDAGRFFRRPLPAPPEDARLVTLETLVRFFRNPCAALLRRLGIVLPRPTPELADDEPLALDFAAGRQLSARLLALMLGGADRKRLLSAARAGIEVPAGELGNRLIDGTIDRLTLLSARIAPALAEPVLAPRSVLVEAVLEGERWQLSTVFDDLRADGLLRYRDGSALAGDRLEHWLAHLMLCAADVPEAAMRTRWFGADGSGFEYARCVDARGELAGLLSLYRAGLVAPLHFFPRTSWAYLEEDGKLGAARSCWLGSDLSRGESDHPAYRLALRGVADPLDARFIECAEAVFGALRRHRAES